ncbi:Scr1 family TA system antitoxin-like transcriptional regulator [Streptomyces sp. NPDC059991]|uniref:Scr1 family TA system antitoxin-like transcriptional regulator n=1 Tax=Streptomyces sp. NPDC059991 TaxID=3347028 RepID=UPI0036C85D30
MRDTMASTSNDLPVRQLVLGANLAQMRSRCGVSPLHAAATARVGTDELARWESGQAPPPAKGLQHLMRLYGQPPAVHDVLARWATASPDDGTRHGLVDAASGCQARLAALELYAVRIQAFSNYTVPTLVRSSAYADNLERMRSSVLLGLTGPRRWRRPVVTGPHSWEHVDVILDASVLTRGFDVDPGNDHPLADQLKYLCKVVHDQRADIRIIPTGTGYAMDVEDSDLLGLTLPGPQNASVWVQTTPDSVTYINGPRSQEHQRAFDGLSTRAEARPLSAVLLHQAAAACTARQVAQQ